MAQMKNKHLKVGGVNTALGKGHLSISVLHAILVVGLYINSNVIHFKEPGKNPKVSVLSGHSKINKDLNDKW